MNDRSVFVNAKVLRFAFPRVEHSLLQRIVRCFIIMLVATSVMRLPAQWKTADGEFPSPKLSVDKTDIDLGNVYSGEIKTIRVNLKNVGKDTLQIIKVQPSCGCTTVKTPKPFLLVGESDVVELQFNSTGLAGKVTKHVMIQTNDPKSPNTSVAITANVVSDFEIVKYGTAINFGNLPVGKQFKETVMLRNISGRSITIRGISNSSLSMKVDTKWKLVSASDSARITISITPDKEGYVNTMFYVETDSKAMPRVPVRIIYAATKPQSQ